MVAHTYAVGARRGSVRTAGGVRAEPAGDGAKVSESVEGATSGDGVAEEDGAAGGGGEEELPHRDADEETREGVQ